LTIDELLEHHTPAVADLVLRLRDAIRTALPDATEKVYPGWHGVGFHHPDAGYVCGIFPVEDHVKVGFERGSQLPDPHGLFAGGGTQVRYVPVNEMTTELADRLEEMVDHAVHLGAAK
jgi:hypothetical protein